MPDFAFTRYPLRKYNNCHLQQFSEFIAPQYASAGSGTAGEPFSGFSITRDAEMSVVPGFSVVPLIHNLQFLPVQL